MFCGPLYCWSVFDMRPFITPFASSNIWKLQLPLKLSFFELRLLITPWHLNTFQNADFRFHIYDAQMFHSKTTWKEYKIIWNVNGRTPNVVYLLECQVCASQYIGESVSNFSTKEWMDTEMTLQHRRESTLCVAGALIGWFCQIQNLYQWPQSKLEREPKT